ncbi:MAG: RNA polymerase factor sigma-54 [Planctomycetes bacterium]|nr:RNA polymerase factor sigma-54 [Planctomycetota bacterium]
MLQSPQMIQAMQILQMPALDLEARIQQELVENPFLEIEDGAAESAEGDDGTGLDASSAQPESAALTKDERREEAGVENILEEFERYERDFGDGRQTRSSSGDDADKKMEAMANTPDVDKNLAEVLIEELAILDLDERRRALAEYLLYSLDDRGFLDSPLEEIALECMRPEEPGEEPLVGPNEPPVTVEELASILNEIRSISHPALGARDLKEALVLQLEALGYAPDGLLTLIVREHLDDLRENRLPRIAKSTGKSIEEIKEALDVLKTLEPTPGAGFGEVRADVIVPEVIVEEQDGEYEVRLDRASTPRLRLSYAYREYLKNAKKGDGVREWVKTRIENAKWFLDALAQRQSTLERIANVIFQRQRAFLDRGVQALKPLRMQEVADEVGVHISTVSRAVSGKYAQTPRGIFALKYFFIGGTQTESGEVQSQTSIKQRIAELVAAEDPTHPLSDEELAVKLEQKDHVKIARRTVTKYRKALSIPSSSQRKQF